ncbi:ABC transporter permease [Glaciihabitans sp. UYNi722]|uniref:ABC transporter permease n=1 Tax=Glaciihabitans sp. UYNi722 TaxID=3156344 RepID=UPI003393ED87
MTADTIGAGGLALPASESRLHKILTNNTFWIFAIDVLLIILFTSISINHTFISGTNLQNLMSDSGEGLLLGIAIAFLLGSGEFDISLGANLILSSVVAGLIAIALAPFGIGIVIIGSLVGAIITGLIVGLVNGLIVTRLNVNSLIATLAMLGIVTGVAYIVSGGTDVTGVPVALQDDFGIKTVLGIPLPFVIAILAWAIAFVALRFSRFGLHLLAMGSSRPAAERAGLNTNRKLVTLFMIAGGLAGIAGFIDITRFAATNIAGHTQDSLSAITAAVIGGTLLAGGIVSMVGLLGGVILAVILANGLVVIGVSSYYQLIVVGVILVIAVSVDQLRKSDSKVRLFSK